MLDLLGDKKLQMIRFLSLKKLFELKILELCYDIGCKSIEIFFAIICFFGKLLKNDSMTVTKALKCLKPS